jgi:RHS repeat-associated protein
MKRLLVNPRLKAFFSILLTLIMIFSFLPHNIFAEDYVPTPIENPDPSPTITSEPSQVLPAVITLDPPSNITGTSATLSGNLTDLGSDSSAQVFFMYDTVENYGFQSKALNISMTGIFDIDIEGLAPNTWYYYQARAVNSVGEAIGEQASFRTLPDTDVNPIPEPSPTPEPSPSPILDTGPTPTTAPEPVPTSTPVISNTSAVNKVVIQAKPDQDNEIKSVDGNINLTIPKGAISEPLDIELIERTPIDSTGMRIIKAFELNALNSETKAKVTQFKQDLNISIQNKDFELNGIDPESLHLYYLDEKTGQWLLVPGGRLDKETKTLTAPLTHFSNYGEIGASLASGPGRVMAAQVDLHSGSSTFSYPLELPPGPSGFKPKLELTYNSGSVDEMKNKQSTASWVGMGWSFDLGRISYDLTDSQYYLELNGASYRLISPDNINYHTVPEQYYKIGRSSNVWTMKDREGTIYQFGGNNTTSHSQQYINSGSTIYRWDLNLIQDTNGNQATVTYIQDIEYGSGNDRWIRSAYPQTLTYGSVQVTFNCSWDVTTNDGNLRSDNPISTYYTQAPRIMENRHLDSVEIKYNNNLIRKYVFTYNTDANANDPDYQDLGKVSSTDYGFGTPNIGIYYAGMLKLKKITQYGADGVSTLPATQFTYYTRDPNTNELNRSIYFYDSLNPTYAGNPGNPATLNWSYLKSIDSGYGGLITFEYNKVKNGNYAPYPSTSGTPAKIWTRWVVTKKTLSSGIGLDQTYNYSYPFDPEYLGSEWYQQYRGFREVQETDSLGNYILHKYYTTGIVNGKDAEKLTGKEYSTEWHDSTGTLLKKVDNTWNCNTTNQMSEGQYISTFASGYGSYLVSPTNLAVSNNGIVYVVYYDNRVKEFDIFGNYLGEFTSSYLSTPSAIAIDQDGNIYIASSYNNTITKFKDDGTFVTQFGAQPQHLYEPQGVAIATDGTIYATSFNYFGISKFDNDGTFDSQFASGYNYGWIAVSDNGDVYDVWKGNNNNRIEHYSSTGTLLDSGYHNPPPTGGACVSSDGYVYSGSGSCFLKFSANLGFLNQFSTQANHGDGVKLGNNYIYSLESWDWVYDQGNWCMSIYALNSLNWNVNLAQVDESTYDADGLQLKTSRTKYEYDGYGNVITEEHFGDVDDTDDGFLIQRYFNQNTSDNIIDKPAWEKVFSATESGEDPGDELTAYETQKETYFYYDNGEDQDHDDTDWDLPPVKGNLTRLQQSASSSSSVSRYYEYDSHGNKTSETDPNGNETTWAYDATYHFFPTTKTYPNVAGGTFSESYSYNPNTMNLDSQTDINGQTTYYQYDTFKRLVTVDKPDGRSPDITYDYTSWGTLGQQRIETKTYYDNQNHYLLQRELFDGLGRVIQTQTLGESGNTIISGTTAYNRRGLVEKQYVSQDPGSSFSDYYDIGIANWRSTSYEYDGLGRVTLTTNPDGTTVINDYPTAWQTTTTNERGMDTTYIYDAFNRLTQVNNSPPAGQFMRSQGQGNGSKELPTLEPSEEAVKSVATNANDGVDGGGGFSLPESSVEINKPVASIISKSNQNWQIDYPGSGAKINIGSGTSTFAPKTLFSAFDGEVQFSLDLQSLGSMADTGLTGSGDTSTITAQNADFKLTYNPVPPKEGFNDLGGLDYSIEFKTKPAKVPDSLSFIYSDKLGVEAYLQPSLTKEFQIGDEDGRVAKVTDTDVYDKEGKIIAHRPDYVVNSIAFYAAEKSGDYSALGGQDYKAGKIGHLYRMKAVGRDGAWAWMDWGITDENTLSLTDTTGFLQKAEYPVTIQPVGDTFGYTTAGSSNWAGSENYIYCMGQSATPASNGTATSMTARLYGANTGDKAQLGFFSGNLSSSPPLVGHTGDITTPASWDWRTGNLVSSVQVTSGTNYYMANVVNDEGNVLVKYDSGASANIRYHNSEITWGNWPANGNMVAMSSKPYKFSIYVNYTIGTIAPTVTNSTGESNVTSSSARLNGNLTDDGGATTTVHVCWGDDDAGIGTWDHDQNLGTQSEGTFYYDASSLNPSTSYYYRCYATNSAGSDWADSTETFTTTGGGSGTFGYSAVTGNTTDGGGDDGMLLFYSTGYTGVAGTGQSMSLYVTNTDGSNAHHVRMAIYTKSGSTYTKVAETAEVTVAAGAYKTWVTGNFTSPPTITAQTYYLCFTADNGSIQIYYDSAAGTVKTKSMTYGSWPSTFTSPGSYESMQTGIYVTVGSGSPIAPTVTNSTGESNVTSSSARLNGNLTDDGGATTTVHVCWGDDDAGIGTWDHDQNLGTQSEGTFYYDASSLNPSTSYYYRCYATNSAGSDWADSTETFTTDSQSTPPSVTSSAASGVGPTVATLNGNLTGLGSASTVSVSFEYGLTTGYGNATSSQNKTATGTFKVNLPGVSSNTTYHYRAKAVGNSTSYGSDQQFTTGEEASVTTTYSYDVLGNLKDVYDNNSNHTSMTYDWLSRKTGMSDPDMGQWYYYYDNNGNLIAQVDAKVQATNLYYDALNRLKGKTYTTGVPNPSAYTRPADPDPTYTLRYTYDSTTGGNFGKGKRTGMVDSVSDSSHPVIFKYDNRGNLTEEDKPAVWYSTWTTYITNYTYDFADRVKTITYPDNGSGRETVTQTYNNRGLPSTLYGGAGFAGNLVDSTSYNNLGAITQINLHSGLTSYYGYYGYSGTYDNAGGYYGKLYKIKTGTLQETNYTWDETGNLTQRQDVVNSDTESFTYDYLDRLTSAQSNSTSPYAETYTYNEIGNILSLNGDAYTYGTQPHAVTQIGSTTYTYDANGNMNVGTNPTWDVENRLTAVTKNGVTDNSTYDGDGNRVKKTEGSTTILYVNQYYEKNLTSGEITTHYYLGKKEIAQRKGSTLSYIYQDSLGSTSVMSNSVGASTGSIKYFSFGLTRSGSVTTDKGFTSQRLDNTGLYYYGARYYDPMIGRFISADTIVPNPMNPQSLNRYTYCLNNPLKYIDPSGHIVTVIGHNGSRTISDEEAAGLNPSQPFRDQVGLSDNPLLNVIYWMNNQWRTFTTNPVREPYAGEEWDAKHHRWVYVGTTGSATNGSLGDSLKISEHVQKSIAKGRPWTEQSIRNTVDNPYGTSSSRAKLTDEPATAFWRSPEAGDYVVVNNRTLEAFAIGNKYEPGGWMNDPEIGPIMIGRTGLVEPPPIIPPDLVFPEDPGIYPDTFFEW